MTKRTPESWTAKWTTRTGREISVKRGWHVVNDHGLICRLDDDGDNVRVEAAAHLIASAPELLEAVRAYQAAVLDGSPANWKRVDRIASAAIAKAEGRS